MLAAASIALSLAAGVAHPHLFFQASDVAALRSAAATTHQEIASHLTQILSQHFNDPAPQTGDYDDPRFFGQDTCPWAFAWQLTGDARYAAQARLRLMTYLGWSDWDFGTTTGSGGPDLNLGHFLLGVSCAYDLLYDYLTPAERSAIVTRLGNEADRMYQFFPDAWYVDEYPQNHNWIDSAGMGLAGLVLQGEDARAANWVSRAQDNLAKLKLVIGTISDGSWHEGIAYQNYGLSVALPFWMALRATGADYTDMGILRGLGRMFLAAEIPDVPRQQILLHGDFTGWPETGMLQILRFAAARFKDGIAETAALRYLNGGARSHLVPDLYFEAFEFLSYDPTVAAVDPHTLPLDTWLPDLQASVLHSTWDKGDLALALKAGPFGGRANFDRMKVNGAPGGHLNWGHDHNDDMSFWLWGSGTWLAPEAAGYDAGSNTGYALDKRANMTSFHNGLLIDGNGELGDSRASESEWNNAWFYQRDAAPLVTATGTADYAVAGAKGASLYPSSVGLSRWDRLVVLARKRYALVRDDVVAASSHSYDWICHFLDGANVDTASGWVQGINRNGMSLGVRVVSPASWTATTGAQSANLTRLFDPDGSIWYVRVRPSVNSAAVQFLTALVPVQTSAWTSRVRIDPLSAAETGAGAVVAPGSALEERWIFGRAGVDAKIAGDLALFNSFAGMAARNGGVPARALLVGPGTLADQNGDRLLLTTESARIIEADLQGSTLAVTGDGIADFQAYAPGVTAVILNGQPVPTSTDSGVVRYPATPPAPLRPIVAITSTPASLTNQQTAAFSFISSTPGSTFSCALDAGPAAACTSTASYTALAAGSHTFTVTAIDPAGTVSAPASFTWTIDLTPPVATVSSGPPTPTNGTSATFTFSSSKTGSAFSCKLDAAAAAPCASPATYSSLAAGSHTFAVTATDPAGNLSVLPASFTWAIDLVPPIVSVTSAPLSLTNQTGATFGFSSNETGSTFACKLDASAATACTSPMAYGALAAGNHVFTVTATDLAGNLSTPASSSWTIDTTPPVATIASAPPSITNQTSATFTFSSTKAGSTFSCSLDGTAAAPCTSPATYGPLAEGSHTFSVSATDQAGNLSVLPASSTWTIDTTATVASINSSPAAVTNRTDATFTFSSTQAGSTFSCSLDAAVPAPCTSPALYGPLAAGTHGFTVSATSPAGNVSVPASFTWAIDTTPPVPSITSGPAVVTNRTGATFTFSSSKTGSTFACNLDAAPATACASPIAYGPLVAGSHTFAVTATDPAGNLSVLPASFTWAIDTTAPVATITSAPAAMTNQSSASFGFSSTKAGSTFSCSLDGAAAAPCTSPATYGPLAQGSHTFAVSAADRAGNVSSPAFFAWTIDGIPPAAAILSGPPALTNQTNATFAFASTKAGSAFFCRLDGSAAAPCTSPASYGPLAAGSHVFSVRASDAAGNLSDPVSFLWTIDTTPPVASITAGPPSATNQTSATFTFSASKPGSRFSCRLDQATFGDCASPVALSGLADGGHVFTVAVTDAAGNANATPSSYRWTVDTVLPIAAITGGPTAVTTETTAQFDFSASKPGATFECQIDGAAGFAACATPLLLSGLAPGDHALRVRACDVFGNVGALAASFGWTIVRAGEALHGGGCSSSGAPPATIIGWMLVAALVRARGRRRVKSVAPPNTAATSSDVTRP